MRCPEHSYRGLSTVLNNKVTLTAKEISTAVNLLSGEVAKHAGAR